MVYIKRELEGKIEKYMKTKEIIAVVGTRQCGKTTMINQILKDKDKVNKVSFDDVKILQLFENDIDSFIEIHLKGYKCLFIDEVQYSKDSGKKLKYIYDTQKTKIIISGSSAADLSIQSLKHLVGRIFIFELFPFSFNEVLRAKDARLAGLYNSKKYGGEILLQLNKYLKEFILYGGYPRVVLAKDTEEKKTVLKNIYSTYLLKEIKEILSLSNNYRLIDLMKGLSLQIGNLINYHELSNISGFSFNDLKKYIHILEETYICRRLTPLHTNKRTELLKIPKVYFFDGGFRNICIDNFSNERTDKGAIYENFIFSELVKKDYSLRFWQAKSGAEVDFIVTENTPLEVKSTLSQEKVTRSFHSFVSRYKPKKGYIVSLEYEGSKKIAGCNVSFIPFVKLVNKLGEDI